MGLPTEDLGLLYMRVTIRPTAIKGYRTNMGFRGLGFRVSDMRVLGVGASGVGFEVSGIRV